MLSSNFHRNPLNILHLVCFDVDDLDYIENDLCYYELVSLGFLLYADDPVGAQYVLQKLLVTFNALPDGRANLLRPYATINPNWKPFVIEALAIIRAKQVLRKIGFKWEELQKHYLPHIPELAVHINVYVKALYVLCERMTLAKAGLLVNTINNEYKKADEHLRFYDFNYLEIFLLDWLSHKIIQVHGSHHDLHVLIEYLKLQEEHNLKELLEQTIRSNTEDKITAEKEVGLPTELGEITQDSTKNYKPTLKIQTLNNSALLAKDVRKMSLSNKTNCYVVRKESAGFILIINQRTFYEDSDPELRDLLPQKKLRERKGTDMDKERLKTVFSSFGYQVLDFDNLTNIEVLSKIRETVFRSFQFDSLIVAILSHGIDGFIYGCNSIPVKIADIEDIITLDTLQAKPKMLIVQACQKDQSATEANTKSYTASSKPDAYVDVIKAMSTVPGHASIRHTATGSWFIQSLCDKIDELADEMQISDVLIAVTKDVTDKRGVNDEVMVPITNFTLRKHFFLPKRN